MRSEFLRGHPPTFSHMSDPLQADDWLRAVERQLDIAQCDDRERVLYAAGQLRGAALDWLESPRIQDREAFTWIQFRERFRRHNVPAGVMKTNKKEFLALKEVDSDIILQHFLFELRPPLFYLSEIGKVKLIIRHTSFFFSTSGDYDSHGVP